MDTEVKKRGRPAGSAKKDKPAPHPQEIIVSYKLYWGKKLMGEKRKRVAYSPNFAELIEAKEQRDADLWAESKIHVNVRSEFLDQAFEDKRIPVSIVPFWHMLLTSLILLFATIGQAQSQWIGSYTDSTTKERVAISYDGFKVSAYYIASPTIKIYEQAVRYTHMPQTLSINGITFIHRPRRVINNSPSKG